MQYSSFFYVPGDQKWDSSTAEGAKTYTLTSPGWRFLSTIEVGTDNTEQWYMSSLYSFLEQWTGKNGLDKRSALYGPSFLAGVTGDFVQIGDCYFRHGTAENYKHVNAFRDAATGSLGMEMGESVTRGTFPSLFANSFGSSVERCISRFSSGLQQPAVQVSRSFDPS
jgi:hypothetical protein